jgi:hypothetical protein
VEMLLALLSCNLVFGIHSGRQRPAVLLFVLYVTQQ